MYGAFLYLPDILGNILRIHKRSAALAAASKRLVIHPSFSEFPLAPCGVLDIVRPQSREVRRCRKWACRAHFFFGRTWIRR